MREEEETSERGGHFDPRGPGGAGEIEGGRERRGEDRWRARGRDTDPPIVHPEAEQNRGSGADEELTEEEERSLQASAADWKRRGVTDADIDRALRMARDHVRRNRRNADDRLPRRGSVQDHQTDDKMPLRGGRFDRPRFSRDEFGVEPPHGLDRVGRDRDAELINGNRELMSRISHEPEASDRRRHAMDSKAVAMTEAQKERMFKRFPEMRRLEVA